MNGTGAKMIDDAAKRVGWGVMLEGDSFDLEDWESALKPSFDPWDGQRRGRN
jgi:hypothetical protein